MSRSPATASTAASLIVIHAAHATASSVEALSNRPRAGDRGRRATMDGPRYIWWNFVSSSKERIEDAKADWKAGRFAAVPGEDEFIPLPDR